MKVQCGDSAGVLVMEPSFTGIKRPVIGQRCCRMPPNTTTSIIMLPRMPLSFGRHRARSCVTVRHEWVNVGAPPVTFHSFVHKWNHCLWTSSIISICYRNVSGTLLWITKRKKRATGRCVAVECPLRGSRWNPLIGCCVATLAFSLFVEVRNESRHRLTRRLAVWNARS